MLKIKEIYIRNFRSIVGQTIQIANLNMFVGLNDAGKSNLIKALNLFFNNETDVNQAFDFEIDYSKLAPNRAKKAKEIIIQIKVQVPEHYKDGGEITWKKIWRKEGLHYDSLEDMKFTNYSKTPALLKRISFIYVPAVKSDNYFKTLLGNLYSCITSDINSELFEKTRSYSEAIQTYTQRIESLISQNLHINSHLTMPENQIEIFKLLLFSTVDDNGNAILLNQRGDGVKARHIPAILKFISEHQNEVLNRGAIPVTFIWGYEEPETGVELSKCFDFAKEFSQYAESVQILMTTHSPAFYQHGIEDGENAKTFFVAKELETNHTVVEEKCDEMYIHERIGIIPLIAPFIAQKEKELKNIKEEVDKIISRNFWQDINTICVEGKTDKITLEYVISEKSNFLQSMIENGKLRVFTKSEGCGTSQLVDWANAWAFSRFKNKLIVVLDKDSAGELAKKQIDKIEKNGSKIKVLTLCPSDPIKKVLQIQSSLKGKFYYEIEHLYPINFWKSLRKSKNLELRLNKECQEMFNITERNESIDLYLDKNFEEDLRDTIVNYNPKETSKEYIFNKAKELYIKGEVSIFDGFIPTIQKIESALGKK